MGTLPELLREMMPVVLSCGYKKVSVIVMKCARHSMLVLNFTILLEQINPKFDKKSRRTYKAIYLFLVTTII